MQIFLKVCILSRKTPLSKLGIWYERTSHIDLADYTGLFFDAPDGQHGVAFRRRGGKLLEAATNADFWRRLQAKLANINNTNTYVEQCVAIAAPNGNVQVVSRKTYGYIDETKLNQPYNNTGYPLAAAFIATNRPKV